MDIAAAKRLIESASLPDFETTKLNHALIALIGAQDKRIAELESWLAALEEKTRTNQVLISRVESCEKYIRTLEGRLNSTVHSREEISQAAYEASIPVGSYGSGN